MCALKKHLNLWNCILPLQYYSSIIAPGRHKNSVSFGVTNGVRQVGGQTGALGEGWVCGAGDRETHSTVPRALPVAPLVVRVGPA